MIDYPEASVHVHVQEACSPQNNPTSTVHLAWFSKSYLYAVQCSWTPKGWVWHSHWTQTSGHSGELGHYSTYFSRRRQCSLNSTWPQGNSVAAEWYGRPSALEMLWGTCWCCEGTGNAFYACVRQSPCTHLKAPWALQEWHSGRQPVQKGSIWSHWKAKENRI